MPLQEGSRQAREVPPVLLSASANRSAAPKPSASADPQPTASDAPEEKGKSATKRDPSAPSGKKKNS